MLFIGQLLHTRDFTHLADRKVMKSMNEANEECSIMNMIPSIDSPDRLICRVIIHNKHISSNAAPVGWQTFIHYKHISPNAAPCRLADVHTL